MATSLHMTPRSEEAEDLVCKVENINRLECICVEFMFWWEFLKFIFKGIFGSKKNSRGNVFLKKIFSFLKPSHLGKEKNMNVNLLSFKNLL